MQPSIGFTGVVLAGGGSRRMRRDKAALVVGGRTLLQRAVDALVEAGACELVLVGAPDRALPGVTARVPVLEVSDALPGEGPLRGLEAGLEAATAAVAVVVGCDMPFLEPGLLALLARHTEGGARLVVPVHGGRPQTLCSAWRTAAVEVVRAHLETGERSLQALLGDLEALLLPPEAYASADPEGRSFVNVNTPADLDRLEATSS
jgi:molybdopterin-guanine dinucleotide biosynthesis protein A